MDTITLGELAELVGGRLEGDAQFVLSDIAPLDEAGPDELAMLADKRYVDRIAGSRAGALLVSNDLEDRIGFDRPYVAVEDAHAALVPLLARLHPEPESIPGVHPTAILGANVRFGEGATIGPYAVLEDECEVGDACRIGPHVVLGRGSRVGQGSILHAGVTLYPGTVIGRRVVIHAGARIGVDGFGYAFLDGAFRKVPQVGGCVVEDDVEIGANTCIDRGSIGETRIGAGCKLDNFVHIAHNVRVGENSAMAAQVGIAGSTKIGKGVLFGGQSGAVDHLEIGDGVQIGAKAAVLQSVEAGATLTGYPARDKMTFLRAASVFPSLPELKKRLLHLEEKIRKLTEG